MPIVIPYKAQLGRYSLYQRKDDFVFAYELNLSDDPSQQVTKEERRDAYFLRAAFEKIDSPTAALAFLNQAGAFIPHRDRFTWAEFQRWQRMVVLCREHETLAAAMRAGERIGEAAEVLKALSDPAYGSSFLAGTEEKDEDVERSPTRLRLPSDPSVPENIRQGEELQERCNKELLQWFRRPPSEAVTVELGPAKGPDQELRDQMNRGGAMIEFLRPMDELRPFLVIRPFSSLQAIAATIWADRIAGIRYQVCPVCMQLYKLPRNKTKDYCGKRCKGVASQRRYRKQQSLAANSDKSKMLARQKAGNAKKATQLQTQPAGKQKQAAKKRAEETQ